MKPNLEETPAPRAISCDVAATNRADPPLVEANQFSRQIMASVQDGIIVMGRDMRYLVWNAKMEELSGMSEQEVLGRTPAELFPFLKEAGILDMLDRAMAGEMVSSPDFPFEVPSTGRKGWNWQLMGPLRAADGSIIGVITTVRDITERKRDQESLALFRALIDRTTDAIEVVDPETGRFLDVNETACQDCGYNRAELLSKEIFDIDPRVTQAEFREIQQTLKKTDNLVVESTHRRRDGTTFPVEINLRRVELDRSYIVAVVRDITERKRAGELLRQSHQRFKTLADAAFEGILISEAGRIIDLNEQLAAMFGYQRDELVGHDVGSMIYPDDRDLVLERIRIGADGDAEHRMLRKDGSIIFVHGHGRSAMLDGRDVRITALRDVTERNRSEERIRQQQAEIRRLERINTLGQMSAGLAHELNQPLASILNYASGSMAMLQQPGTSAATIEPALEAIRAEARRAGDIIRWLRSFVRKQEPTTAPLDINDLVHQTLEFLAHDLNTAGISQRLELDDRLPRAMGVSVQVIQVLVNLIRNAIDAMQVDSRVGLILTVRSAQAGSYVRVEVADLGCGMSAERMGSMFEPFFTTKPDGIGMGLAVSRAIVTDCGGELIAVPGREGGMTMSFTLPVAPRL